jgi:hypothetical protein
MWAWIGTFYADPKVAGPDEPRAFSPSSPSASARSVRCSRVESAIAGFTSALPLAIVVCSAIDWGASVVADSAQFSAIVTEATARHQTGNALTLQLAAGFTLTVFTIFLVPIVRDASSWGMGVCDAGAWPRGRRMGHASAWSRNRRVSVIVRER